MSAPLRSQRLLGLFALGWLLLNFPLLPLALFAGWAALVAAAAWVCEAGHEPE